MSVLVYLENTDRQFRKSVFETISYAKAVADQLNTSLTAISIGDVPAEELQKTGRYGVSRLLNVASEQFSTFVNQAYASVIAGAARREGASVIVIANTFSGRGLAPRVAAKLSAGLADGAIALPETAGGEFHIKKTAFSGKAFAIAKLTSPIKVIALTPNRFELRDAYTPVTIEAFVAETRESDFNAVVRDMIRTTDKIPLPDAEIVVSGGRGLKGPENWGILEDLAAALGAATACSKPVSDAGWRPHEEHVGQTGLTISPGLYFAIGISGAIQHLAGVSSSKTIVVINKDPDAPFFKVADYGIVGDAFEVVPKLTAAINALKAT